MNKKRYSRLLDNRSYNHNQTLKSSCCNSTILLLDNSKITQTSNKLKLASNGSNQKSRKQGDCMIPSLSSFLSLPYENKFKK